MTARAPRLLCASALALAACASAPPLAPPVLVDRSIPGYAVVDGSGAGMAVEGLRGTLSPRDAREAIEPEMESIAACFAERSESLEEIGGSLEMRIRVRGDGTVLFAGPEDSTVGDREVERCVGRAIEAARFPRPNGGGEAEVRWSLSVDPPPSVRAPATWDPRRVAPVVRRRARAARARCAVEAPVQVTAYVTRGGRVISAGAASTVDTPPDRLDCVAAQVRAWRMPAAPRVTKVTFELAGPRLL